EILLDRREAVSSLAESREAVHRLLQANPPDEQAARLRFALWEIDPGDDQACQHAADLYRESYQRTGNYDDRQRYHQLSGELLPQRHQAPPLPPFLLNEPARNVLEMIVSIPGLIA
ncbi:MAG TPA: hypothetical protein VD886_02115, partial [Herpetosiphonaceae bacterium]|nr:hypothetical protein [Herpetosiphonaceae bacterium]